MGANAVVRFWRPPEARGNVVTVLRAEVRFWGPVMNNIGVHVRRSSPLGFILCENVDARAYGSSTRQFNFETVSRGDRVRDDAVAYGYEINRRPLGRHRAFKYLKGVDRSGALHIACSGDGLTPVPPDFSVWHFPPLSYSTFGGPAGRLPPPRGTSFCSIGGGVRKSGEQRIRRGFLSSRCCCDDTGRADTDILAHNTK